MFIIGVLRVAGLLSLTATLVLVPRAASAQTAPDGVVLPYSAATPNCVVSLDPVQPGQTSSHVSVVGCYSTFAEAVSAGTRGAVHLASNASPQSLTRRNLAAKVRASRTRSLRAMDCTPDCTGTIIGIDYWDTNWQGSSLMYTTTNSAGCTAGSNYYWSSLPSPWNDQISSARSYTGCEYFHHWVNTGFSGGQYICVWSCANLGALNDTTSSVGLKQSS